MIHVAARDARDALAFPRTRGDDPAPTNRKSRP